MIIITWVGLHIDFLELIGNLPIDSRESEIYHLPHPVVIITWVGLPIDSLELIGSLLIDSWELGFTTSLTQWSLLLGWDSLSIHWN